MKNITKKSWAEFRETGLFAFINSILHVFGWCLVVEVDNDTQQVTDCYPARTIFRGFSEADQDEYYSKIGKYLKENAAEIANENQ
jgi:hypothetical protein